MNSLCYNMCALLPCACDCGRMANDGHCGASAVDILCQDISANVYVLVQNQGTKIALAGVLPDRSWRSLPCDRSGRPAAGLRLRSKIVSLVRSPHEL
jgi:hypothetical protein